MWVVGHLGVGGAPLRLEKRDMAIDIKELRKVIADCYWPTSPVTINELLDRLEAAEAECLEQARLNGMGAEREAALLAKLEAAEKSDAESLAMYRRARDERDALKDKIERMEQQRPFAWIVRGGYPVPLENLEWQLLCGAERPTLSWTNQEMRPLYALPGAQTQGEEK